MTSPHTTVSRWGCGVSEFIVMDCNESTRRTVKRMFHCKGSPTSTVRENCRWRCRWSPAIQWWLQEHGDPNIQFLVGLWSHAYISRAIYGRDFTMFFKATKDIKKKEYLYAINEGDSQQRVLLLHNAYGITERSVSFGGAKFREKIESGHAHRFPVEL